MNVNVSELFEQLKLVDRPDSEWNAHDLPQTLDGCEGESRTTPTRNLVLVVKPQENDVYCSF